MATGSRSFVMSNCMQCALSVRRRFNPNMTPLRNVPQQMTDSPIVLPASISIGIKTKSQATTTRICQDKQITSEIHKKQTAKTTPTRTSAPLLTRHSQNSPAVLSLNLPRKQRLLTQNPFCSMRSTSVNTRISISISTAYFYPTTQPSETYRPAETQDQPLDSRGWQIKHA